jgi:hypothetical protein
LQQGLGFEIENLLLFIIIIHYNYEFKKIIATPRNFSLRRLCPHTIGILGGPVLYLCGYFIIGSFGIAMGVKGYV